jgi:hypothetical protein
MENLQKEKSQTAKLHKHTQKSRKHTKVILESQITKSDLRP